MVSTMGIYMLPAAPLPLPRLAVSWELAQVPFEPPSDDAELAGDDTEGEGDTDDDGAFDDGVEALDDEAPAESDEGDA